MSLRSRLSLATKRHRCEKKDRGLKLTSRFLDLFPTLSRIVEEDMPEDEVEEGPNGLEDQVDEESSRRR